MFQYIVKVVFRFNTDDNLRFQTMYTYIIVPVG